MPGVGVDMQKGLLRVLLLLIYIFIFIMVGQGNLAYAGDLNINASAAVLIEEHTSQILFKKKIHSKLPPASLTKILTAVVALENSDPQEIVEVSRRAAYQEGSSIYLEVGEKITLKELIYGILLASGNDAAVAIAEHVAGSVEDFACLMNHTAKKIGAVNSNFTNPSGLPDPSHYSTAYDLALITRHAMNYKTFREITATKNKTISWAGHNWGRGIHNHNKMLWDYKNATGGKTGYTRAAGRCLITTATKNNRNLIAVVLNCPSDWYEVTRMLDYGFDSFVNKKVIKKNEEILKIKIEEGDKNFLELKAAKSVELLIKKEGKLKIKKEIYYDEDIDFPIKKGDILGVLIVKEGEFKDTVNLKAAFDIDYKSKYKIFLRKLRKGFSNNLWK